MAQVFLSYDREDGTKARVIAQALERAGHFVWWDMHIKGGAEYGRVIEEALEKSDAVVVLWSERSVVSAWVRDEAAAGRDKNCLIPVLLEPVSPPMGFRQYQNLDFANWKGRGKPSRMADLLSSIDALGGSVPEPETATAATTPVPISGARSPLLKWALVGAVVMAILVALSMYLQGRYGSRGVQTVAVTSADAVSGPLARDLLVKLSALQGAKSGSMRLLPQATQDADFIFEEASAVDGSKIGANVVLMAGKDRAILWSKDFDQPSGNLADLKQQIAFTSARVLGCALLGVTYGGRPLDQQTLKLYLNACAQLNEGLGSNPAAVIPSLEQVIEKQPGFAPAWGDLLLAQGDVMEQANVGDAHDQASVDALKRRIRKAKELHPDLPEIKLAEMLLLPSNAYTERMRLIEEAQKASPNNPTVLNTRANGLRAVGRLFESIEDAKKAADADPLSPFAFNGYISALAYAGRIEVAREQLAKAEQLWPGTEALLDIQFRFHLRFGDPNEALRLGHHFQTGPWHEIFLKARAEPTPANIDSIKRFAVEVTKEANALAFTSQALGQFNLNNELYDIVLQWRDVEELAELDDIWFRPALKGFRKDPRFMILVKRMGLVDYWRKSGKWPDFCAEPDLPYDCKAEAAKLS